MTKTRRRFRIALSFPGERRRFVGDVAKCLAKDMGKDPILYDRFHEAEFARPDLDTYLPALYRTESELIAVFLCTEYAEKQWCKLEWRFIRREPELQEICRNQFLFIMTITLIAEEGPAGFVATRATIYERFLQRFLGRWEKLSPWQRSQMENFLKELAVDMCRRGVNRSTISEDHVLELLRNHLKEATEQELTAELRYLLSLGLLHGKDTVVSFFQETFQEFLCAKWLKESRQSHFPINDVICSFYNEMAGFGETRQ